AKLLERTAGCPTLTATSRYQPVELQRLLGKSQWKTLKLPDLYSQNVAVALARSLTMRAMDRAMNRRGAARANLGSRPPLLRRAAFAEGPYYCARACGSIIMPIMMRGF